MDLNQSKLTRKEWESIELPVSTEEKQILKLIIDGYNDVTVRYNEHLSLFSFVKIEKTPEMELFLYQRYFEETIKNIIAKYAVGSITYNIDVQNTIKKMKSADGIRIKNQEANIQQNKTAIFEFLLLEFSSNMMKNLSKDNYEFYLYTLIQLKKLSILHINKYVMIFVDKFITYAAEKTKLHTIIEKAYEIIEQNKYIMKYEDRSLFPHQKNLFSVCKQTMGIPKLILYTAPTATGKTLSPIGLSNEYRIIFVCVARHIGLALARSAISMEKKVAFAFGCETASDIRLHYFSAVDYIKNSRSGGIGKVDNGNGSKVEIMICDVQ